MTQEQGAESRAPVETHREVAYLKYLVQTQAPVCVKLRSGETFSGFVEYYDKRFIRLTRQNAPNLFIFKHDIKYLYEEEGEKKRGVELQTPGFGPTP